MRISDNTFVSNFLSNITKNKIRTDQLQVQLASGKQFTKPSERPLDADFLVRNKHYSDRNKQYLENIQIASNNLLVTSEAIDQAVSVFQDALESVIAASTPTNMNARPFYAQQFENLIGKLTVIANSSNNGKYLFGGSQTVSTVLVSDGLGNDRPWVPYLRSVELQEDPIYAERTTSITFNPDGLNGVEDSFVDVEVGNGTTTQMNLAAIEVPIGDGINVQMNMTAAEAFNEASDSAFTVLLDIRDALDAGDPTDEDMMRRVKLTLDHFIKVNEKIGAQLQMLDAVKERIDMEQIELENMRALREDTDIASAVVELQKQQTQLEAAYKMGASILPKSLVDFLR
jgi:flagellar hook-associated protein 3 FlgL